MFLQQSSVAGTGSMLSALTHVEPESNQVAPRSQPSTAQSNRTSRTSTGPSARESIELYTLPIRDESPPATHANEETPQDVVEALETLSGTKNKYRLAAICLTSLLGGFNDSAAGALIPYMEEYYDIGYAIVSLIFVGAALGWITAAPIVARLRGHLGLAKTFALSQIIICCGYIPILCSAPFPVIVVSFYVVGFGCAVQLPLSNVFCASFANAPTLLGLSAGAYGLGGIASPLIATAMVTAAHLHWSRYYLVTLGIAAFNAVFTAWSFQGYDRENHGGSTLVQVGSEVQAEHRFATLSAFKSRVVLLGALFVFTYQGAEVSVSGWVVSFLIDARGGDPSQVGYVSAGFWAGITLGRFLLSPVGHKIGEKVFIYGLIIGSVGFELLVWLVPNVIGNAVAVAIVGLLLGPVWPCATIVFTRNLSRKEQVSGLSIISAFGSSGGAFMPLAIGLLSQKIGTYVLHPVVIGLCVLMIIVWLGIPAARKRAD